jgi:hypothetical protein
MLSNDMSRPVFNAISHEQHTQIVSLINKLYKSPNQCKIYNVFNFTAFTFWPIWVILRRHTLKGIALKKLLLRITEELLEWKSSGSGSRKPRLTAVEIRCADYATPSIRKSYTNFADKRRSLGQFACGMKPRSLVFSFLVVPVWQRSCFSLCSSC